MLCLAFRTQPRERCRNVRRRSATWSVPSKGCSRRWPSWSPPTRGRRWTTRRATWSVWATRLPIWRGGTKRSHSCRALRTTSTSSRWGTSTLHTAVCEKTKRPIPLSFRLHPSPAIPLGLRVTPPPFFNTSSSMCCCLFLAELPHAYSSDRGRGAAHSERQPLLFLWLRHQGRLWDEAAPERIQQWRTG